MTTHPEEWTAALVAFAAKKHAEEPAPSRHDFTGEEEQQCRILGGHLISWMNEWGPNLIMERNVLATMQGWDKNPHIVYATAGPGLAAACEILDGVEADVTWLTAAQFQEFLSLHPDENQVHHCILESWFRPVTAEEETELRVTYATSTDGTLRIHHDHTLMGPLFTRGGLNLWSYKDEKMTLVKEGYQTWVS